MPEQIYLFKFSPIDNPPSRDMVYQVFTTDENMMNRFLKQHNFVNGKEYVEVTNRDGKDVDIYEIEELDVFRFGSNIHRDKTYEIVTSKQLVDETMRDLGSKLSAVSLFNGLITQQNIPLIEKVSDMIEVLPFAYILNVVTVDEYESMKHKVNGASHRKYDNLYYIDNPEEPDDCLIYESLFESSMSDEIQPATIEEYIETFVSLITDEFK